MTTVETSKSSDQMQSASERPETTGLHQRRRLRGRWTVVGTLIAGLLLSFGARNWALSLQTKAYLAGPYANASGGTGGTGNAAADAVSTASGNLDSYFLVLLLGGLRGPLVMYLWSSSENQKNERDLEDFSTKVNLIGKLQPEFDSVWIFQVWNLAYNISVQIPSLPDRYAVIIDAANFAKQAERSRPNNVNILLPLNQVYQQKLGMTAKDSDDYKRWVRRDTQWREPDPSGTVGTFAQRHESLLGTDHRLLSQFLGFDQAGKHVRGVSDRPADLKAKIYLPTRRLDELRTAASKVGVTLPTIDTKPGERQSVVELPESDAQRIQAIFNPFDVAFVNADWNDGSELQYLARYQPYNYGVSPLAIGYNYGKRAQVLINRTKQKPAQYSASLVDSRPGIELRDWAKEERDRALDAEVRLYGRTGDHKSYARWLASARIIGGEPVGLDMGDLLRRYRESPGTPPPDRVKGDLYDEALAERHALMTATVGPPPVSVSGPDADEALFSYRQAVRLLQDARAEFIRHLNHPEEGIRRLQDFSSQIDELALDELIARADHDFLLALTPEAGRGAVPLAGDSAVTGRRPLLERAANQYVEALLWLHAINLRYYSPAEVLQFTMPAALPDSPIARLLAGTAEWYRRHVAFHQIPRLATVGQAGQPTRLPLPPGPPRMAFEDLRQNPPLLAQTYIRTMEATRIASQFDQNRSNRDEGRPAEDRIRLRLATIDRLLKEAK